MSQSGQIVFYTEAQLPNPKGILGQVMTAAGATKLDWVTRSLGDNKGWVLFKAGEDPDQCDEQLALDPDDIAGAVAAYRDGDHLWIKLADCKLATRIAEAVSNGVDESVRNGFVPGELGIRIGWHDLFEWTEEPDGQLLARPFLSLYFWGYNCPLDWEETRRQVFNLPGISEVKKDLETITGPLKTCAYWEA